jgi:hypothetical protein
MLRVHASESIAAFLCVMLQASEYIGTLLCVMLHASKSIKAYQITLPSNKSLID